VVVDGVSLDLIKGSTVDWDETLMKSSFVVSNNPNAESSCGCKSSFSVKA
jgi:iron-sulfur cluster assembly accessory protein